MRWPVQFTLIAVFSLFATTLPAQAATDLGARPGKDWKHKATNVRLPASLTGLTRAKVSAFRGPETDVAGDYWSADGSDTVTVYLYRNVSGSVPLWFDRARSVITLQPQKYGDPQSTGARAFTPRGQAAASGLMEIFSTTGSSRSTGVIVLPVNGFYAKIRASSKTRDAAGLEQLMLAAANAFDWSSESRELAAQPLAECPGPLPVRSPAKLAKVSSEDRMMAALLGGVVAQAAALEKEPASVTYCREPGPRQISFGVYRPDASRERYMMALSDAGQAVLVGNSDTSQILTELKEPSRVSVSLVQLEKTITYADFDGLPSTAQVVELVEKGTPLSMASTWGKKRNLTIGVTD